MPTAKLGTTEQFACVWKIIKGIPINNATAMNASLILIAWIIWPVVRRNVLIPVTVPRMQIVVPATIVGTAPVELASLGIHMDQAVSEVRQIWFGFQNIFVI